jgi:CRISP-associated protein Cas1
MDRHLLPRFRDTSGYLYAEHARIDRDASAVVITDADGRINVPAASLCVLFLGPGTSITHAAIGLLSEVDCLVEWVGEGSERFYASGCAERTSGNLLHQVRLWADPPAHLAVVHRMYAHRFGATVPVSERLEVLRGREGLRMRAAYAAAAERYGVAWSGRSYHRDAWAAADPVNRALSAANVTLYAYCQAAILALGLSPALGFIHTGSTRSLVFDIADLYKAELIIPLAFATATAGANDIERRVRQACRTRFDEAHLGSRMVTDTRAMLAMEGDAPPVEPGLWDAS